MAFTRVCSASDLGPGELKPIDDGPEPIALANIDGTFHAVDDTCTHDRWSLCDGYIEGEEIICSLHLARFHMLSGAATMPPAYESLKVYPVKVEGDDVFIDFDAGELKDA